MSIEQITMPKLGESVTEGTISKWLVSVGDKVNKYDPLAEVMTDKVNAEVPSSFAGTIRELVANEGDTLEVGAIICTIEVEGTTETKVDVVSNAPALNHMTSDKEPSLQAKARYSPAVLKLSQDNQIDLSLVTGTGANGRITRKDLLHLIQSGNIPTKAEIQSSPVVENKMNEVVDATVQAKTTESPVIDTMPGDVEWPVTPLRKAIAGNMLRSKHEIPHAWLMVEVDATNLVQYRNALKSEFKAKEGFNLTFFAFFVKAVAQALKEFPMMNSMWAGDKIIQKKDVNLSIAVATDDALFVPVIKHADEKTIKGIAREIHELAIKVRSGKLSAADMEGGTFTVNNTGSFGSVQSMGIINYPQAAILQVESIVKRPVVMDGGMIGVRDMVNLCLSIDHRVLDGLIAGRFLKRVKTIIEQMSKENTSVY